MLNFTHKYMGNEIWVNFEKSIKYGQWDYGKISEYIKYMRNVAEETNVRWLDVVAN